jgi:MFS family permease
MLIVTDLGRAAALVSVPALYALDALTLWQLYAVGFVAGTLTVFFEVAYVAYLPSLVERRQLAEGNAKLETTRSAAYVGGPGLGGVLVQLIGAPAAILADAVSYVASALFLGSVRSREERRPRVKGAKLRVEVVEGIRFVLSHPYMRPSIPFVALSNFFYNVMFAVFLVYAVRRLGLGSREVGLVFSVSNIGFLLAALTAGRLARRLGTGPAIIVAAALVGPGLLLVPLAPASHPIPFFVAGLALSAYGGVTYNISALSYMQATTPNRLLGRMNATRRFIVWGTIPLGSLLGGVIASQATVKTSVWVGAIGATVAFVPVLLSPFRRLQEVTPLAEPTAAGEDDLRLALDSQVADA